MIRSASTLTLLVGASLGFAACTNNLDDTGGDNTPPADNQDTSGGDGTSFDHPNDGPSPWDIIDRLSKQGPTSFSSHMHACPKIKYESVGTLLASLGVNMTNTAAASAGLIYKNGASSLAAPSYVNRVRENVQVTTSGSSTLFDIFVAAAPEIITNIGMVEKCKVNGTGVALFDGNTCKAEGISCLIGAPAQQGHVELCNLTISRASDPITGQRIAVAALLAAAFTCE